MKIPTNPHAFKVLTPREMLSAARSVVEVCMADGEILTSFQREGIAEYLFNGGGAPSLNQAKAQVKFWVKQEIAKRKA
tara:strand:+ start:81 stop:314 length:234 start_codon:yes stop_codon:yes gene_type:complete